MIHLTVRSQVIGWLGISKTTRLLAAMLAALLVCVPSFSQVNTGRVSGAVTDQTGGAIGGAMVTIVDVARGDSRVLMADSAGNYAAPNLTPGAYTVRAEFRGFKTIERQNVTVSVGGDIRVDLTMQPGEQNQTVTVTESLPIVNTTNAQTGGTLDNSSLMNLPLNGRNYRWTVNFVPGVMLGAGEGTSSSSTNGTPMVYGQNYMIDGLYEQSAFQLESSVGGQSEAGDTTLLPLDAVQEVNLVINPKAEYGWAPGVTISVGLKSGTNAMHGSAYAFGRDQSLDSKNAFAATRQPLQFEQWGATLGGPIKKNKLFYFLGYESERVGITSTFTDTAPTTQSGLGTSSSTPDAIADIIKTTGARRL